MTLYQKMLVFTRNRWLPVCALVPFKDRKRIRLLSAFLVGYLADELSRCAFSLF
jgi:hypothetical protein